MKGKILYYFESVGIGGSRYLYTLMNNVSLRGYAYKMFLQFWTEMGWSGRKHIESNYNLTKQIKNLENIYDSCFS